MNLRSDDRAQSFRKQVLAQAQICGGPATWLCAVTIASLSRLSSVAISMNSSGMIPIRRRRLRRLLLLGRKGGRKRSLAGTQTLYQRLAEKLLLLRLPWAVLNHQISRFFRDHDGRRVGVAAGNDRHDRRVHYAKPLHAVHAQLGVDHSQLVAGRSHLACAYGVVQGLGVLFYVTA